MVPELPKVGLRILDDWTPSSEAPRWTDMRDSYFSETSVAISTGSASEFWICLRGTWNFQSFVYSSLWGCATSTSGS